MSEKITFDAELIRRYDRSGPRYTSYPTAVQFVETFDAARYREIAARSVAERPARPLSLYFHIPFCDTVCFYCACNKHVTKDRGLAQPYLDRLQREIAMQAALFPDERVVEQLHWGGGTPTFISAAQMHELMARTREHFRLADDVNGEFSVEVDPREAPPETIRLLREIGFNRLSMGVQDFDPAVQKAVNRLQPEEITLASLDAAREHGFRSISLDLIYGLPKQSAKTFAETLDKIVALGPDRLSVFNYAHLPELFKPQRRINPEELPSPAEKLDILQLTTERLAAAGYVYIGMDHFARPDDELAVAQREGTLYRNFQGYSTHAECDLIGLGATSIGSVGPSYAQNRREIANYYEAIDGGDLAVFRGVELDADDLLRRAVITELICHFRLVFADVEAAYGIDFADYFARELEDLAPMQDDGLLRLAPDRIDVTPAGRFLIRNICMVFDRYLRESASQRFSKVI
ncbi:MAG: oxygen-independent coproporphyrinogen III oxidase [Gammaproteobacteria bacterium]|nr:oxygen-independent coproporphyrinogen III oxidase [Gammaproteobacteria bacterium]